MNAQVDQLEQSAFLFARPSFIEGMGRILDFTGMLSEYNCSLHGIQADRLAFLADTSALRGDIARAREQIRLESFHK